MSHRPRESLAFPRGLTSTSRGPIPASSQSSQPPPSTSRKPRPDDDFNFPFSGGGGGGGNSGGGGSSDDIILRDEEIVQCISSMNISFTLSDLQKPSPSTVQVIFEHLVSELMGVRRETVDPLVRIATTPVFERMGRQGGAGGEQNDPSGEPTSTVEQYPDAYRDTLPLLTFFRSLSRLMQICNVHDLSLQDLLKPDYRRLKIQLSQIINFSRFRADADRLRLIEEQITRPEEAKVRLERAERDNHMLIEQIRRVERQIERDAPAIKEARTVNDSLTEDLRSMKKKQTALMHDFERERSDRKKMAGEMENKQYLLTRTRAECDKIRPYIVDSPATLQQIIADMTNLLNTQRSLAETLERTTRALVTSAESFQIVAGDVGGCISVMEDCEGELVRLEEVERKVGRNEEVLKARENETRDVERNEALLRRQLDGLKERIEKGRQAAEGKRREAQRRMEELREVYEELARERAEKEKEMERKKMKVEQIEKKMADLREVIENEVHSAHIEMAKMKAHIEGYIREMEQKINAAS